MKYLELLFQIREALSTIDNPDYGDLSSIVFRPAYELGSLGTIYFKSPYSRSPLAMHMYINGDIKIDRRWDGISSDVIFKNMSEVQLIRAHLYRLLKKSPVENVPTPLKIHAGNLREGLKDLKAKNLFLKDDCPSMSVFNASLIKQHIEMELTHTDVNSIDKLEVGLWKVVVTFSTDRIRKTMDIAQGILDPKWKDFQIKYSDWWDVTLRMEIEREIHRCVRGISN